MSESLFRSSKRFGIFGFGFGIPGFFLEKRRGSEKSRKQEWAMPLNNNNLSSSRRNFLLGGGVLATELLVASQSASASQSAQAAKTNRHDPDQVLRDMLEGNQRFVDGKARQPRRTPRDFQAVSESQRPRAVVITCADSRVTPEILFDQGIGDIFVVRIAGNAISGSGSIVKGTIEFAVAELDVPLVMVLGHSNCGAVKAALQYVDSEDILPGSINELVDSLKPAVALARRAPGDLLENSIRANVLRGVQRLRKLDPIVASGVGKGTVKVVGAVYALKSGKVQLIEKVAA
jgi:carbonic anhydrase